MIQHPLLPVALCYVAGVLCAAAVPVPLPLAFLFAFVTALAGLSPLAAGRGGPWLLGTLCFLTGLVNLTCRTSVLAPHDLRAVLGTEPALVTLRGRLAATPTPRQYGEGDQETQRTLARVEAQAIEQHGAWQPVLGTVAVSTPALLDPAFFGGRCVEIYGVLAPPPPARAPGLFDARTFFAWQGIHYRLDARTTNDWRLVTAVLQPARPPLTDRFVAWARRTLAQGLPEDEALQLLWAMTLGWRTALTGEVAASFMRSGTLHIFAISGLHILLIAGILGTLLRVIRVPRRMAGLLLGPALWFYAAATGWQPSAVRATLMMTMVLVGWALERPGSLLNSLAGAGLLLLLWEPRQLFQAGFQLSFAVVLSLALLMPPLERLRDRLCRQDPLLPEELLPAWRRWLDPRVRAITSSFAVSLAAWLGSLPLIAHYFHLLTPVTLLANLLVVPLSGLALSSSLASLACTPWAGALGECLNHSAWFWMSAMIRISDTAACLPGAFAYVPSPGLLHIAFYYALLVAASIPGKVRTPGFRWAALALLGTWTLLAGVQASTARATTTLVLLPLGGGHAVWVDTPSPSERLLVDGGNAADAQRLVVPFLRAQGVHRLENLAFTHGDIRHSGGSLLLDAQLQPARVWTSPVRSRSPTYREYLRHLATQPARWHPVSRGDTLAGWQVLHPASHDAFAQADDNALVLRRDFYGTRVLLLSDLGRSGEAALLEREADLRADVVMAGLPAKGQPLSEELLAAIQPRLVVIADDEYPATALAPRPLRQRLLAEGRTVLYTSDTGALTLRLHPSCPRLETLRPTACPSAWPDH